MAKIGTDLEINGGKESFEVAMKRNKRTEKVCHTGMSPLTERILTKMGSEGAEIRQRLRIFYQTRVDPGERGTPEGYTDERLKQA